MQLKAAAELSQERRVARNLIVMTIGEAMVMIKKWNWDIFILMLHGLGEWWDKENGSGITSFKYDKVLL